MGDRVAVIGEACSIIAEAVSYLYGFQTHENIAETLYFATVLIIRTISDLPVCLDSVTLTTANKVLTALVFWLDTNMDRCICTFYCTPEIGMPEAGSLLRGLILACVFNNVSAPIPDRMLDAYLHALI